MNIFGRNDDAQGRDLALARSMAMERAEVSAVAARQAQRIRAVASVTRTAMMEVAITAAYRQLLLQAGASNDVVGVANIGNLGIAEILTRTAGEVAP